MANTRARKRPLPNRKPRFTIPSASFHNSPILHTNPQKSSRTKVTQTRAPSTGSRQRRQPSIKPRDREVKGQGVQDAHRFSSSLCPKLGPSLRSIFPYKTRSPAR